jgi:glycosyltransferase involved in cell wall biosynthesis
MTRCSEVAAELVLYVGDPTPWRPLTSHPSTVPSAMTVDLVACAHWHRWRPTRILWEQFVLPRRAAEDRLDLLHATGYILPLACRLPTVLTIFDLLALTHPEFCKPATRLHYRLLLPISARRARKVIVPSRTVRDQVCGLLRLATDRVEVIAPGIHPSFAEPPRPEMLARLRQHYDLPQHFVLCAGNLEPKKNLMRLVQAFQRARRAGLEGELILVGGAGWGTGLALPRPAPDVRWLGYVPPQSLPGLFHLASEVAFPAFAEGFGLPVVEAMASGTVVIASGVPAVAESDPQAVIHVDPLSIDSLALGLLRGRREKALRRRLINRGRRAAARFSWQRAAEKTWRVYEQVLADDKH